MSNTDLATVEGVLTYLADTPFASDAVTPLTGGFGNYAYRVHLRTSLQGQDTVVLKHAKPYVPGMKSFVFPLERQTYEVAALRRLKEDLPRDAFVTVPAVHLFDSAANVIIMDDAGEHTRTLKQFLQDTPPAPATARQIGAALGAFIGTLHARGSADVDFYALFAANAQGRMLSARVTYARLVSTLTTDELPMLADPPLAVPQATMAVIAAAAKETGHAMLTTSETIVMGDFWPGNILVVPKQGANAGGADIERLFVVDWELVKPGLAGLDVGQFCAELHLLCRFNPVSEGAAAEVMSSFLEAYRGAYQVDFHVAKTAAVHIGAHLVAWTPRSNWGTKDRVRKVVMEGVKYLVESWKAAEGYITEGFVRESIVGSLLR